MSPYRQTHSGQFGSLVQKNSAMVPFAALHDQPLPQPLLLLMIAMMSRTKKVLCAAQPCLKIKTRLSKEHLPPNRTNLEIWEGHLTVPLQQMISATHHGIYYVGDDNVIHFCGNSAEEAIIRLDTLGEFALGRLISTVPYNNSCKLRHKVLQSAFHHLHHSKEYPPYDSLDNNCEHFCEFMQNWRKKSPQAQTLKVGAAAGGFAIGGPIGAFVASFVLDKYVFSKERKKLSLSVSNQTTA